MYVRNTIMNSENLYLHVLDDLIKNGEKRKTRDQAMTRSIFCPPRLVARNVLQNFPLLTTKSVNLKHIFNELMWFIRGQTDASILNDQGTKIWNYNTSQENLVKLGLPYAKGDTGPMYGFQWRHNGATYEGCDVDYTGKGFDQLQYAIDLIKNNPTSRRIVFTTWSPTVLKDGVLAPCHGTVVQCYVRFKNVIDNSSGKIVGVTKYLDLSTYQRSADWCLGVPYNIASYSLLLILMASVTGCEPGHLYYSFGDAHIYENHVPNALKQISRTSKQLPQIRLNQVHDDITKYKWEDIQLIGYKPDRFIQYNFVL